MKRNTQQGGFIQLLVFLVIVILLIKFTPVGNFFTKIVPVDALNYFVNFVIGILKTVFDLFIKVLEYLKSLIS